MACKFCGSNFLKPDMCHKKTTGKAGKLKCSSCWRYQDNNPIKPIERVIISQRNFEDSLFYLHDNPNTDPFVKEIIGNGG